MNSKNNFNSKYLPEMVIKYNYNYGEDCLEKIVTKKSQKSKVFSGGVISKSRKSSKTKPRTQDNKYVSILKTKTDYAKEYFKQFNILWNERDTNVSNIPNIISIK